MNLADAGVVLQSLSPDRDDVACAVEVGNKSARVHLSLKADPDQWAVVATGLYWFAVTVTGDFTHFLIDEEASDDEIRENLKQMVHIGVRYLEDQPVPQRTGRLGFPRVTVNTREREVVMVRSSFKDMVDWIRVRRR